MGTGEGLCSLQPRTSAGHLCTGMRAQLGGRTEDRQTDPARDRRLCPCQPSTHQTGCLRCSPAFGTHQVRVPLLLWGDRARQQPMPHVVCLCKAHLEHHCQCVNNLAAAHTTQKPSPGRAPSLRSDQDYAVQGCPPRWTHPRPHLSASGRGSLGCSKPH